jgi:hypothetical protein
MAVLVFVLGVFLAICGLGGLIASFDMLPTETGMLYAVCGVIAVSAAFVVLSIGALIRRVDALGRAARSPEPNYQPPGELFAVDPASVAQERAPSTAPERLPEEEPVNENRAGHLPTLAEVEEAIAHPEPPPSVVGRYSAGGASYVIFSDGTIEAELEEGAYRFGSFGEFKAYVAGRKN